MTQLVSPAARRGTVLSMAHDASFAKHLATDKTTQRIHLGFWFPHMKELRASIVHDVMFAMQKRAPVGVSDRVLFAPNIS